jgi:KDO2-lipid IV(A) lauroyltransferase
MRLSHYFGYAAYRLLSAFLWVLPWKLVYLLSDVLAFLLYKIIGYRRKVMDGNIRLCFADLTEAQRNKLIRENYRHIADVALESIKGGSLSQAALLERFRFTNGDVVRQVLGDQPRLIVCSAHLANFEWGGTIVTAAIKIPMVGFYKSLRNSLIDAQVRRQRAILGMTLVDVKKTKATFENYRDKSVGFGMISDQGPSSTTKAIWVSFFGMEVPCLHGLEQYAHQENLPVFYVSGQRDRRGFYSATLLPITTEPRTCPPGDITQRFMALVEADVRRVPGQWLWTHRRFRKARLPEEPE